MLVQNLRDLMTGKHASVKIHELPGVKPLGGLELTAMVGDRKKEIVLSRVIDLIGLYDLLIGKT